MEGQGWYWRGTVNSKSLRLSEQSRQINFAEWCVAPLCLNSFNTIPRNNELHWFSFHLLHFIQTIKTYALQRVSVRES